MCFLLISPEIPKAEFELASKNFSKSVKQVFSTAGLMIIKTPGVLLVVRPTLTMLSALPAHRSLLTRGNRSGLSKILQFQKTNERLAYLHKKINTGSLDNIAVLETIIKQLEFERFSDVHFRYYADRIILDAKKRKKYVQEYYMSLPGSAK